MSTPTTNATAMPTTRLGRTGLVVSRQVLGTMTFGLQTDEPTSQRILDKAFDAELQRTLAQGFGEDREEFDDHIRCAAIPIFDRMNQTVAGMSVSFPTFRYDTAREPELVAMLRDASRDISRQLGCSSFPLDAAAKAAR